MTTSQPKAIEEMWHAAASYLETALGKSLAVRRTADRVGRIIDEEGPALLIADAVADGFDRDTQFCGWTEIKRPTPRNPVIAWDKNHFPFLVMGKTFRGQFRVVSFDTDEPQEHTVTKAQLKEAYAGGVRLLERTALDVWQRDESSVSAKRWFWDSIRPFSKIFQHLVGASVFGNTLAVAVSIYALQVWDRVVPAQSLNSLAVLMVGALVAVLFELTLKLQRAALIDDAGRAADRMISLRVFRQIVSLKADARPRSLGSLASQVRELNQIREAMSSSMLSAAIDLPFSLIFVVVIYFLGGVLVVPILAAMAVVLLIGLAAQVPLSRLAAEGLEEASIRNGLIVETVLKADEIKLNQAEPTVELRWLNAVETANEIGVRQRKWRNFLTNASQSIQQIAYIAVVSLGALYIIDGQATLGEVIACSILTNRTLAPLAQVANVMGAFQGSRLAKRSIDEVMKLPSDLPNKDHLRRSLYAPRFALKNFRYSYPGTEANGLIIPKLEIPFGTKLGIVGKIGSGKSTLLRVLSGIAEPTQGTSLIDNTEIKSIHPDDLRLAISYQSQNASLMRGTVRDNLKISKPSATDDEMIKACEISGTLELVKDNPQGLDLLINEAGDGLSGGQKQSLLLARTILRDSPIVLLDEPTASMDSQTEAKFIEALAEWGKDKTIIIATHRSPPLSICSQMLVLNEGQIVMEGNKEDVLAKLRLNGAAK